MWFSKPHYAYALAQYCKANNITAEQIKRGKAISPARGYHYEINTEAISYFKSEGGLFTFADENLPRGIHKGVAIENLVQCTDIEHRKTITVGDYYNDIIMLRTA